MIPRKQQTSSDPGAAKSSSGEDICRDYLWGTCNKHTRCIYRHELDIEKMKETLKFCHDYQNRNGCTRANCKFIHATKEEQDAFQAAGQVPRVLAERHAALASTSSNMTNAETIPQIAMFINESFMAQPRPAPWPPLPPPQAAQPVATSAPPPPAHPPRLGPAPQPAPQAQLPPPPPAPTPVPLPAPTATTASTAVHQMYPNYHAPQAQNSTFPMNQPPPMVPADFNPSMPPPPMPTHINQHKRKLDSNGSGAGPSKTQKDGPELQENFCESCVERKRRIDGYKMQMETLHNEEETQILVYKKKLQEYEMGRDILKSLVEPDMFRVFDDLIEGVQTSRESLTNLNSSNSSFVSGTSAEPMQAMFKFFQMMLGGSHRNEPVPSTSRDDESQVARRLNSFGNYPNQSPDIINLVLESFKNGTAPERSVPMESSDTIRVGNKRTNGLNQLANGQETTRYGVAPGYSGAGMVNQSMTNYSLAGPSGYGGAGPGLGPPPSSAYAMFNPAIRPPPNRHYYGQSTSAPNVSPNLHFNGASRAPVAGPSQGMQRATSPAALRPTQTNTPTYNQMGRHPQ